MVAILLIMLFGEVEFINQPEYKHKVVITTPITIVLYDNEIVRVQLFNGAWYDSWEGED